MRHSIEAHSVQFVNASGRMSAPFYFWDNEPYECSVTWQLVRSEFDLMMLRKRRRAGRRGRARVVVDASGQSALLQNRFKLRTWDPVLNKGAIWTYWENAYRDEGRDEGATLVSFGRFVKSFPHLKGGVTDLLIGDLFDDRVDVVWEPMATLTPPNRPAAPGASQPAVAPDAKMNELVLPTGSGRESLAVFAARSSA